MSEYGEYETIDGRPALKFERRFAQSVDRVWRAVTDPAELAHWFPATMEIDRRVGGHVTFTFPGDAAPPMEGEVAELDPPRVFAFTWVDDLLRFELERTDGDGCLLRFTHILADVDKTASVAAGWHVCFEELDKHLAGQPAEAPGTQPTDKWRQYYAEYLERGLPAGAPIPD
jgi:uncharacterized protein YndB with AHSA1/START domain